MGIISIFNYNIKILINLFLVNIIVFIFFQIYLIYHFEKEVSLQFMIYFIYLIIYAEVLGLIAVLSSHIDQI